MTRLIDIKECAELLGLSSNTLYSWVSQGKIPYVKVGRSTKFDIKDIEKWIEGNKVEPFKLGERKIP